MVALKAWMLAFLLFHLDPGWAQTNSVCENVPVVLDPSTTVQECRATWTKGDAELDVLLWTPTASRDMGAMKAAATYDGQLLGAPVQISRTSLFQGVGQEVLAASTPIKSPKAQLMIYSRHLELDDFRAVLTGVAMNPDAAK